MYFMKIMISIILYHCKPHKQRCSAYVACEHRISPFLAKNKFTANIWKLNPNELLLLQTLATKKFLYHP